jgi:hypothetical protein
MFASLPILLAAGFQEIISILGGLIVFVIWLVNQINDAKKKQLAQEQRVQAEIPPQPAAAAAAAGGAPPADPLRAQVDEFLRRAGKQPAPAQPAPLPPPPRKPAGRDEVVVLLDEPAAEPPRKSLAEKMRSQDAAAAARRAKPMASQPPRQQQPRSPQRVASQQRPKSVAEHVAEHVGAASQEFRKEVADLGERVRRADEQFDVQLHQKFDHELSGLAARRATSTSDQPPTAEHATPAAQIAALLASPDGVRQAIVLNEILHRPVDRW